MHRNPAARRPRAASWLAALLAASLLPAAAAAQNAAETAGAAIEGYVRETETDRPVAGAHVLLRGLDQGILTDAQGHFRISNLPSGSHVLVVRSLGHRPTEFQMELQDGATARAILELDVEPVRLGGVTGLAEVPVSTRSTDPRLSGFWQRRDHERGTFITRAEIERRNPPRFSNLFHGVPGVRVVMTASGRGFTIESERAGRLQRSSPQLRDTPGQPGAEYRQPQTASSVSCPMQVYVDGVAFPLSDEGLDFFQVRDIEAVEVYPGASQIPVQFKGLQARCGVMVIWTR